MGRAAVGRGVGLGTRGRGHRPGTGLVADHMCGLLQLDCMCGRPVKSHLLYGHVWIC